ncbi:cytochrome C [Candidatus Sulfurimonas marisnigri]|uniref:Cytochrome C n=1 Tax=Candidatus Sulfurimonas marisnigri TaxID=2740405 RepID=A0A7S7LYL2_9BACT|nr:cytochrome C [Candidatus Sulfurimonas marisnigri]QOY53844.1 cytochrome C [Candidatus Sulfurimonas marisnigri]
MKRVFTAIVAIVATTTLTAEVNVSTCTGCHGTDWSKAALNKSKNVAEMTHSEIADALKGYKAGTYGGPMKGLMKGQVAKYSDADLDAFSLTVGK